MTVKMYTAKIFLCVVLCVKIAISCHCNLENMIKDTVLKTASNNMEKRQMPDDAEEFLEEEIDSGTTEGTTITKDQTTTRKFRDNFNTMSTETTEESKGVISKDECFFAKNVPESNIDKIVDVWKIYFYKASEKLACFKIHIKKISDEDRKYYRDSYGDFNGSIDWSNCLFEVTSSATNVANIEQKHFLQGAVTNMGVFKNIIVTKEKTDDLVTLLEQSPDQWMVVNHLLLMRDCDNGDIVVFSRVPIEPIMKDIEDALAIFAEDVSNGTFACETLRNPKYHTLS